MKKLPFVFSDLEAHTNKKTEDLNMSKNMIIASAGIALGVAALGAAGYAVWNSKQLRAARAVKRTGKIMHQVGTALCSVSGAMGE